MFGKLSVSELRSGRKGAIVVAALGILLLQLLAGCDTKPEVTGVGAGLSFDIEYVPKGPDANVYSAKYICGETKTDHPLVRAVYRSEISIVNPDDNNSHEVSWRAAFVYPATPPATSPEEQFIGPFRGIEINCGDIRKKLSEADQQPSHAIDDDEPLIKGYIIVNASSNRIRVTGAYTALHKQIHGNQIVDLVPKASCELTDGGIVVSVLNQGEGNAPATTTEIAFAGNPPISLDTPPLAPGEETEFEPVPLPDPDAQSVNFTVTADATGQVDESNEGNNQLAVVCEFTPGG
ncbi:CARDB domain-containing protein [Microbulbifer taiwanensis]|uniref:CARDB domain-containing protein n=2 Tax=Microbulbifer taiwanensis TaxID=986746 RepID=A0ABW1YIY5_9GAMM